MIFMFIKRYRNELSRGNKQTQKPEMDTFHIKYGKT